MHHSDRGSQYLSIRYTEHLGEAGVSCSVGSRGDSYDNAMAETIIEPIGDIPPAELEAKYRTGMSEEIRELPKQTSLQESRGDSIICIPASW